MPGKLFCILSFLSAVFLFSCSPKNISTNYYYENEKALDRIEESYKELYPLGPFTIGFTSRDFKKLSLEIITDTLSYIYEFGIDEPRLLDTLKAYRLDAARINTLIKEMHDIRCTWITYSDYYVDEKKQNLILMSIKPVALKAPFSYAKYYVLTYFPQPQYFDSEGRLLDKRSLRRLRKINGEVFRRINNKVCYAVTGHFR
ncbi:MAG: hypothetical protein JNM14_14645 [Ferruginibacter sp.]|nr:hypothetical protein [Ferruginibacter sp.]